VDASLRILMLLLAPLLLQLLRSFMLLQLCLPEGLFSTILQKVVLVQSQVTFLLCLRCLEVLLYIRMYQLTWNRNQISGYRVTPWDDL